VQPDGSVRPRIPAVIQFRDAPGGPIRPTAPFFEVWGRFDDGKDARPLTNTTLMALGGSLARVTWRVSVANLKAARRTKNTACGFSAEIRLAGDDHSSRPLLAISPNVAGTAPLVSEAAPIPLGSVQVIRPFARTALGVDLDVLRLRFSPAAGEVYGPPTATVAADPDAPAISMAQYEIVPESNRILNQAAAWSSFQPQTQPDQPEPPDTFDGVIDLSDRLARRAKLGRRGRHLRRNCTDRDRGGFGALLGHGARNLGAARFRSRSASIRVVGR
jgi:hypothetical protein